LGLPPSKDLAGSRNFKEDEGIKSMKQAEMSGILLSEYVKDTRFDPKREITKERNI
jgi:hypothetical protein